MIYLQHPTQIPDPDLRELLELRYQQLGTLEGMIIVEPGDSMSDLEAAMGFTFQLFDDDPDSVSFEFIEDHGFCYEMAFIFSDDGNATVLFIPKQGGINAELLNLCRLHAIPAVTSL